MKGEEMEAPTIQRSLIQANGRVRPERAQQPCPSRPGMGLAILAGLAVLLPLLLLSLPDSKTGEIAFNSWQSLNRFNIPANNTSPELVAIFGKPIPRNFNGITALAISPDGETVAWGGEPGTLLIWQVFPPRERFSMDAHRTQVTALAFSPSGEKLASGSRSIKIWDPKRGGKPLQRWQANIKPGLIRALAFSPDGGTLASGLQIDNLVHFWNPDSGQEKKPAFDRGGMGSRMSPLAYSPDGQWLAVANNFTIQIRLAKVVKGVPVGKPMDLPLVHGRFISALAFFPDSKTLATASEDHKVILWDVDKQRQRAAIDVKQIIWSMAVSPDGQLIATADHRGQITAWHANSGRKVWSGRPPGNLDISAVAFSPDSRHIAAALNNGTLAIYRLPNR